MQKFVDKNQTSLDIEVGDAIAKQKIVRRNSLKKTFFDKNQLSFDHLNKITFELSCKDFEYFYAYILEQEGYESVEVSSDDYDMVDIRAKKDGKVYLIQCKQWTSKDISVQEVADMYSKMYHEYAKNVHNTIMRIVTTSYFDSYAMEFLNGNHIESVNNLELVGICERRDYFSESKWKDMKTAIYKERIERLKSKGILNPKERLRSIRFAELIKHSKNGGHGFRFHTQSQSSKKFLNSFFQYWNLV